METIAFALGALFGSIVATAVYVVDAVMRHEKREGVIGAAVEALTKSDPKGAVIFPKSQDIVSFEEEARKRAKLLESDASDI